MQMKPVILEKNVLCTCSSYGGIVCEVSALRVFWRKPGWRFTTGFYIAFPEIIWSNQLWYVQNLQTHNQETTISFIEKHKH